ncbi:hypothetical protein ACFVYP_15605 [Kitasatospora sp. NPDC058201]|uniref:hypothetical protein n=1 Tax=unclassified Kitasatospora TaxID=2633591 RepID=UPI00364C10B0
MSGSPMYSSVSVGASRLAAEAAQRRRQAERRRRLEQERARERARRAAARARSHAEAERRAAARARARAEAERRERERVAQALAEAERRTDERRRLQEAERAGQVTAALREQGTAAARGLDEVAALLDAARSAADPRTVSELTGRLADLRSRALHHPDAALGAEVEELRGRAVALRPGGQDHGRPAEAGHEYQLGALERQFTMLAANGADVDAAGRRRCAELLHDLRRALMDGQTLRVEALMGTAEHELARHALAVQTARTAALAEAASRQADERHRRAQELAAERRREAQRRAAELQREAKEQTARRIRVEAERQAARLAAELAEAVDRLAVVEQTARDAARDAADFGETELQGRLLAAVHRVAGAIDSSWGGAALTAVAELERLLPEAEARLDELLLAFERRAALAGVLKEAMAGEGLAFSGGGDLGQEFVLIFERPNGARYETSVSSATDGTAVLSYTVEGESDVVVVPERGEVTCDRTEALLDRVHEAMGEEGYHPGELDWDGKPPRGGVARPGGGASARPFGTDHSSHRGTSRNGANGTTGGTTGGTA